MMTCIAVDDEPMALDVVKHHLDKIPIADLKQVFTNGFKAIEFLHDNPVDLVFMDISMPDVNGMELSKSLNNHPMIIFTTAYTGYAVESYEINAVDYLLKPVTFDRFLIAVNRAFALYKHKGRSAKNDDDFVFIKTGIETYKVNLDDLLYVEANGNYVNFIMREKKILSRMSFADATKLLPESQFIRIHRSFIISFQHLTKVESHQVTVAGKEIPLGDVYRERFFAFMNSK
jgi:DNA-binding LytR/AlgR family response regulator